MKFCKLLLLALGISSTAMAADWYPSSEVTQKDNIQFEPLMCPTIGKDYSQMMGQLQMLQDSIKKDANCGQLAKNLQNIGHLAGERRDTFLEAIAKMKKGETLKDSEIDKKVIDYIEDITLASGTLGVMLAEGDQCFGDQDPTTSLIALSSFVNEASTLLTSVGGPWGAAIGVGGKVTAGFLTGISKFIASRPGFKFRDKKNWQGYVESLCAFHDQQGAIDALIHPGKVIDEMAQIDAQLQDQIQILEQAVPQTDIIIQKFNEQDNAALQQQKEEVDSSTQSNAGLIMVQMLTAQRWVRIQMQKVIAEANDPLAPSKYLVQKYRDEIEDFMIDDQGPDFVHFQEKEARNALRDMKSFVFNEGSVLYMKIKNFETANGSEMRRGQGQMPFYQFPAENELLNVLLNSNEYDFVDQGFIGQQLASAIVYFKRELNQKWDALNIAMGTKKSFCVFFERAGYLNAALQGQCYSQRGRSIEADIHQYVGYGLQSSTPMYISRSVRYKGNNWMETLGLWANSL